jgi:hypothetical protein
VLTGFLLVELVLFEYLSHGAMSLSLKRWLAFLAGSAVLAVAGSLFYLVDRTDLYAMSLGAILGIFLLIQPVGGAVSSMLHPNARPDIRMMIGYFRDHRQPGDIAYVYHHPKEAFTYYATKYGIDQSEFVIGSDSRSQWVNEENAGYQNELAKLSGRDRVWVLFASVRSIRGTNEERGIVRQLDRIGTTLDHFRRRGGSAYLYDLRSKPAAMNHFNAPGFDERSFAPQVRLHPRRQSTGPLVVQLFRWQQTIR